MWTVLVKELVFAERHHGPNGHHVQPHVALVFPCEHEPLLIMLAVKNVLTFQLVKSH